jgi:hypothetical protein
MGRRNKHVAAALALGLAVSALATPSFAQRSEGGGQRGGEAGMSANKREKALRLQRQGRENVAVHLGAPATRDAPNLHDGARRAGVILLRRNPQAHYRRLCPLPGGERAALFCNMKEWVREFGSVSTVSNPLTPTLSPNGERERTEFAARSRTVGAGRITPSAWSSPRVTRSACDYCCGVHSRARFCASAS